MFRIIDEPIIFNSPLVCLDGDNHDINLIDD